MVTKQKTSSYSNIYLPDILINTIKSGDKLNNHPVIEGGLLFADLSGFTAMSEKLAALGRIGAENLAEIMNNCFNSLLGRVFALQGDVIKFGGDAFLAYFSGDDSVKRAYICAANLIKWISENGKIKTEVGEFSLGIHTGISYGQIYNLFVGDEGKRREHLFCGQTVEKCYAAADVAELGELALTLEAYSVLGNLNNTERKDEHYVINKFDDVEIVMPSPRRTFANSTNEEDLNSYIITGLEPQLHFGNGAIEGEHRVLTSLFISVNSLRKNLETDQENSITPINEYFSAINNIIEKHGGAFARLDSSGSSEKMLVFFGAPVSSGYDAHNCLKAVLEIEIALKNLNQKFMHPITHRYGVNTGLCFVGDVGGESRREYTAMGDAVNLAARLMGKAAYSEALIGESTLKICDSDFITKKGDIVALKGKKEPVQLHRLVGMIDKTKTDDLIIGREAEQKQASEFIDEIANGRQAMLLISGEPGAGKSLLCGYIRKIAETADLKYIEGACFRYSEKTPYGPLRAILLGIFELNAHSTQKERRVALIGKMKEINESEWLPMVAPLLDFYPSVPPYLKNLPDDVKKEKIKNLLVTLICRANIRQKTIITVEDVQWIDDTSFNIIKAVINSSQSPGFLFISRPSKVFDELKAIANMTSIELAGLTADNSRKLFLAILDGVIPDEDIIRQVIEKSGGNPFYLEEMAKAFRELGKNNFVGEGNIPTGIESVITARIDNLGEMLKRTVRTASVIGRVFAYDVLKDIFPDRMRSEKIRSYLSELAHLDLTPLERIEPVLEYIFKHILTQEVAYNGLSFSARQALHLKAAEYYASHKRLVKHEPEVPGRHYLLAGKPAEALPFLYLAAEKAVAEFANSEALAYFGKVIEIAEQLNNYEYLIKALHNRGELAKHIGDFKAAEADYLRLAEMDKNNIPQKAEALKKLSEIYRLTTVYDKSLKAINELENILPLDIAVKVFCLNGRGEIARRGGKLQDCQSLLFEALKLCNNQEVPDQLKALVYNNLGVCHWGLGKLKESAEYYREAQKLYRQLKDLSGQSKVMNNLAIINDEMGKLDQAAKSYEKAERIFKRIGATRMQALVCANLGTNFFTRGLLAQARERLTQAKQIFEKIGDQHSLAYAIGDIGFLQAQIGNWDEAKQILNEALEKAIALKDDEFILESKIRLIYLNQALGNNEYTNIEDFIAKAREIGSIELEIKAQIRGGILYSLNGDFESTAKTIQILQKKAELYDFPELVIDFNELELIWYYISNQDDLAYKKLIQALKKANAKNLALKTVELSVLAQAIGYHEQLPVEIIKKIKSVFDRIAADIGENDYAVFNACYRRKIAFTDSLFKSLKQKYNGVKLSEYSHY